MQCFFDRRNLLFCTESFSYRNKNKYLPGRTNTHLLYSDFLKLFNKRDKKIIFKHNLGKEEQSFKAAGEMRVQHDRTLWNLVGIIWSTPLPDGLCWCSNIISVPSSPVLCWFWGHLFWASRLLWYWTDLTGFFFPMSLLSSEPSGQWQVCRLIY